MTLEDIAKDEDTAWRFVAAATSPTEEEIEACVAEARSRPLTPDEEASLRRIDERVSAAVGFPVGSLCTKPNADLSHAADKT